MTARSRRRKRDKRPRDVVKKKYPFYTNSREVLIEATDLQDAKTQFQERFGFWPEKEVNYGIPQAGTAQAPTPRRNEQLEWYLQGGSS